MTLINNTSIAPQRNEDFERELIVPIGGILFFDSPTSAQQLTDRITLADNLYKCAVVMHLPKRLSFIELLPKTISMPLFKFIIQKRAKTASKKILNESNSERAAQLAVESLVKEEVTRQAMINVLSNFRKQLALRFMDALQEGGFPQREDAWVILKEIFGEDVIPGNKEA